MRNARADDQKAIERLLVDADLPTEGVADALADAVVAERDGRVVAVAALEPYGEAALLRSVVVDPALRGAGLGRTLVEERLAHAAAAGIDEVYLLTTTAEGFFAGLGFARIGRDDAPAAIRGSAEFASICPASAAVMRRRSTRTVEDMR